MYKRKIGKIVENSVDLRENPLILHPLLAYLSHFPMSMDLREITHKLFRVISSIWMFLLTLLL